MVTETDWGKCPNITKIVKDVFDGLYTDEHEYISSNLNDDLYYIIPFNSIPQFFLDIENEYTQQYGTKYKFCMIRPLGTFDIYIHKYVFTFGDRACYNIREKLDNAGYAKDYYDGVTKLASSFDQRIYCRSFFNEYYGDREFPSFGVKSKKMPNGSLSLFLKDGNGVSVASAFSDYGVFFLLPIDKIEESFNLAYADLCGKNRVYTYNYDTALAEYNRNTQQAENDYNSAMQSYNATVASIDQQYEDDRASYNDYLQKKREYDNYIQQLNTYNAECARIDREYDEAMRQYEQDLEEYNRTYGN